MKLVPGARRPPPPASRLVDRWTSVAGVDVFYREARVAGAPVMVHLHGFGLSGHYLVPTAELLSAQGAKVLINDLDADVAQQTASEIAGDTVVHAGDLTKEGAADELVKTAVDAFGKLDIIVNNAGYTLDAPVHKLSDDWFQRMLDIHTIAPFRVLRAAAPHLREPAKKEKEEGVEVFRKVVNISSI